MNWPTYPRIPHLARGPGITRDDLVLSREVREQLLSRRLRIEEKLDGANISFAIDADGHIEVASRGGRDTIDRGGHLGRARVWAAEHSEDLRILLAGGRILYGEWLLTRHGVGYDALPDLFVGFDLLDTPNGWISVQERDERLHAADLSTPPTIGEFQGIGLKEIDELIGTSEFGAPCIEGVILRALDGDASVPRLAKRLADGAPRVTDTAFGRTREHNRLAHR